MKKVDKDASKERLIIFQEAASKLKMKFRRELFNKNSLVLFENQTDNKDEYFGRDEFSNSVIVKTKENLVGKLRNIKILTGNQNSLKGEINLNAENEVYAA